MLPLSALGGVIGSLCLILIHNQWGVYLSGVIGGISGIVGMTTANSLYFVLPENEHRNGQFSLQWMVSFAAQSVGFILGGWILDHHVGFRTMFIIGAVAGLISYPLYKWAVAPIPDRRNPGAVVTNSA
jgi:MFS family permease